MRVRLVSAHPKVEECRGQVAIMRGPIVFCAESVDLIDGISKCCSGSGAINQTFNLTYGNARKINDLLDILKSEFPSVNVNYIEREKFMPERGTLNTNKAKKLINYDPKFNIEDGYKKYIAWYKSFWKRS